MTLTNYMSTTPVTVCPDHQPSCTSHMNVLVHPIPFLFKCLHKIYWIAEVIASAINSIGARKSVVVAWQGVT